jgi:hypothetical protein
VDLVFNLMVAIETLRVAEPGRVDHDQREIAWESRCLRSEGFA